MTSWSGASILGDGATTAPTVPAGLQFDSGFTYASAYEGNFTGDGRKSNIAVLSANQVVGQGNKYFQQLSVMDASAGTPELIVIDDSVGEIQGIAYNQIQQNLHIVTGDLNGDGLDEIIVMAGTATGGISVLCYYLPKDAGSDVWKTPSNWKKTILGGINNTRGFMPGITHSIAAGDLNRDGCDDIAYTFTEEDGDNITYILYGEKDYNLATGYGLKGNSINLPDLEPPRPPYGGTYTKKAQHGVAIADVDGKPGKELLIGFTYQMKFTDAPNYIFNQDRQYGDAVEVFTYDYAENNMLRIAGANTNPLILGLMHAGTNINLDTVSAAVVTANTYYGINERPAVMLNGRLYKYNKDQDAYASDADLFQYSMGDLIEKVTFFSVRPVTLNGSEYGIAYHYKYDTGSGYDYYMGILYRSGSSSHQIIGTAAGAGALATRRISLPCRIRTWTP